MAVAGRRQRRQAHGRAWLWKQTDCWYYTQPGTKKRVPLFDVDGRRIRGKDNRKGAELALARIKLAGQWRPTAAPASPEEWLVAKVCSEYLQNCERRVANGTMSPEYRQDVVRYLNDLCTYCGALPVSQLKKGYIRTWLENHPTWSPVTQRNIIAIVQAAFNHAQENSDVANPLKGLKKPPAQPRLQSLTPDDEQALYQATDESFRDFLFALIHTGLRPFCELARMTADMVLETERGMMWRVYSSKTRKTRKIPVRAEVAALTRKLMRRAPAGSRVPLFGNENACGRAWRKVTGVSRFLKLKKRLHWQKDPVRNKHSCYTCRHTFAHRMLSGYWNGSIGCSIETLAELMGDTPKVAFDHYGREWGQHYQEPLWAAIGSGTSNGSSKGSGVGKRVAKRKKP